VGFESVPARFAIVDFLGGVRDSAPVYGSGGFTSYSEKQLQDQLAGLVEQGITRVKMKIGRDAKADVGRVAAARDALGPETELFVDANRAYSRKQALETGREVCRIRPKRGGSAAHVASLVCVGESLHGAASLGAHFLRSRPTVQHLG